jgi:uncharacterized membrane protein
MAAVIQFFDVDDRRQFSLHDHIVDACKRCTAIYNKEFTTVFRIFDEIDNLNIDHNRIRINYTTGAYLLIKP